MFSSRSSSFCRIASAGALAAAGGFSWGVTPTGCEGTVPTPHGADSRRDEGTLADLSVRNALDHRPRFFARDILINNCEEWKANRLEQALSCDEMRARLRNVVLLPGTSNPSLNEEVAYESGLSLARIDVGRHADGECSVRIDEDVSGRDVFVIQAAAPPINDSLIEALLLVSAARRADARTITLVAPSLPYSQDSGLRSALGHLQRHGIIAGADGVIGEVDGDTETGIANASAANNGNHKSVADMVRAEADAVVTEARKIARLSSQIANGNSSPNSHIADETYENSAESAAGVIAPLSAADIARLFVTAGVDRVISVDIAPPGTGQFEGFYPPQVPIESLRSSRIFVDMLSKMKLHRPVVVSPHEECIHLAADVRHGLQVALDADADAVGLAVIVESGSTGKDRFVQHTNKGGVVSTSRGKKGAFSLQLIGDVQGRDVVITDHLIDTAKTLVDRTALLKANGARRVVALATHAIFSGQALQRIAKSPLSQVIVSNTIPLRDDVTMRHSHKIVTGEEGGLRCDAMRPGAPFGMTSSRKKNVFFPRPSDYDATIPVLGGLLSQDCPA